VEIAASWDRTFARLGLPLHEPAPAAPSSEILRSWDTACRARGIALRDDVAPAPAPASLTVTQASWIAALARTGLALREHLSAPPPTAMQASWDRAFRRIGARPKSDDVDREDASSVRPSPSPTVSEAWDRAFARAGLATHQNPLRGLPS
jgi:hypothetical protein